MIKLITRNEIVGSKKLIASELAKIQRVVYDEETLNFYKQDNEEHLYQQYFDFIEQPTFDYNTFYKVISPVHTDITTFTKILATKLTELFRVIKAEQIIVVSHLKLDFFGNRTNDYEPLINAYKKLERITGDTSYNEAFVITPDSLAEIIDVLFWLTRCDPSVAEYIFLFDEHEQVELYFCKYGNVHLTEFNTEKLTNPWLSNNGWQVIEGEEFDNFSETGKIEGRRLKL